MDNSADSNGISRMLEINQRLDQPLDAEAGRVRGLDARKALPALVTLRFAFQSLGVVYGDLGTSPLYVYHSTFPDGIGDKENLIGVLSLIIYSLTLIPLLKYAFIVMRANDNGEGGTFALYSLICRHTKVNTIPSQHPTDQALTTYSRHPVDDNSLAGKTKRWLEAKLYRQKLLVLLVLVGTCMLIGDGILTPAISVLSSVGGIKVNYPHLNDGWVVIIACIILVGLFSVQRFGTDKVGWLFAPVVLVWLISIGSIGVYNAIKHDSTVFRAFSPFYIIRYFINNKKKSWVSLGGVLLSITGTEALYADVGHFSPSAVQIAFTTLVFPCLLASYIGQASYLSKFPHDVDVAFYKSLPAPVYWPMLVVSTIAAIIASQATISATFSIIKQSVALGCFPRVKVVHTSKKFLGQIYIPEINWILMVLCIIITAGFRKTVQIGNAYGIAVVAVMLVTTVLMTLVMLLVWRTKVIVILIFSTVYLFVELVFFSSMLFKFDQGGWAPLAIAAVFLLVSYVWHYGTLKRYEFEMHNKVSMGWILGLGPSLGLVRVPGIGFIYTELAHGVPTIFSHFMTHLPAIHSVVVFVCVKYLPVNTVPQDERFLIRRIGPRELYLFRCVARYGYKDLHKKDDKFEDNLLQHLSYHIQENASSEANSISEEGNSVDPSHMPEVSLTVRQENLSGSHLTQECSTDSIDSERSIELVPVQRRQIQHVRFAPRLEESELEEELKFVQDGKEAGVVHILGDVVVRAKRDSHMLKKFAVDYIYAFLRRICRENSATLNIPHESVFNIGQVYYV